MSFFEDVFDTGTAIGKITLALTFLVVLWLVVTGVASGLMLYQITHPELRGAELDVTTLLNQPEIVSFPIRGEKNREGWFFPGFASTPTIILCPGYRTDRSELITMVSALQKDHFNVFVFNLAGHGKAEGATTLGWKETTEILAAVDAMLSRTDVDRSRVGVWGFDVAGYAAISAALADKRIQAVAVDSIFDDPREMFDLLARNSALAKVPFAPTLAHWGFVLMNWGSRKMPPLMQQVPGMKDTSKLFIQGRDNPALAETTLQLFLRSAEPRKQEAMAKSNYAQMQDEERKAYEAVVVHFFLEAFSSR